MPRPKTFCTLADCDRGHWARGYCRAHYFRFKAHGDPRAGRSFVGGDMCDRIRAFSVVADSGCWEWSGSISMPDGYGKLYDREVGRPNFAHLVSYREFNGPLIAGMQIDHLCRNRRCCNPEHLEQVTAGENIRRAWAARRATA